MPENPNPNQNPKWEDQSVAFIMALANPAISDRDAIWEGAKCAVALYATDPAGCQTMFSRLAKWNAALANQPS